MDIHASAIACRGRRRSYPTVQLLHTLPDGSAHIDWLLSPQQINNPVAAPEDAGSVSDDARLITFRLPAAVHTLETGQSLPAERIADHRVAYLTYEGPIAGDRGHVRRIAEGQIVAWDQSSDRWLTEVRWTFSDDPAAVHQHLQLDRDANRAAPADSPESSTTPEAWVVHCCFTAPCQPFSEEEPS